MRPNVSRLLGVVVAFASGLASAQSYPTRPVRLVVPFVPGGTIDAYARALARQVESQMGQPIVIDNRAGANGILGADVVAKAAPDGYTLLNNAASFVINASMYKKLPYDTARDFTPITNFVKGLGYLLVAHPSVPASSVKELIELAKKKPNAVRFSSPGIGNGQHLAAELMNMKTGIQMLHVPYKGSSPALAAVLGGEVQVAFQTPSSVLPLIQGGKLKALGFSGEKRLPALSNVPTIAEAGVPGYTYDVAWHAWFGPAGMPSAIVNRLYAEIRKALQEPKLVAFFREGGFEPRADAPAEFAKIFRADIKRYGDIVKAAKIEPE
ncbi:MAG TPA: tripartite tricarboxylate transporter substrate binding protein [Burkholderiales bacterium]|nr:tripartite tricarboxylate transporter substrate binding protein [Burkholderiales bacterium]